MHNSVRRRRYALTAVCLPVSVLAVWSLAWGVSGTGAPPAPAGAAPAKVTLRTPASIRLVTYRDPNPSAQQRFLDINDNSLSALRGQFDYAQPEVTLTYDKTPGAHYFIGHIEAKRLKPNFAYQLKLMGKPVGGRRGWRTSGDDVANERIGAAGRWWCDTDQHNADDYHHEAYSKLARTSFKHTVVGYLFMGDFVTDEAGNASVDFTGDQSYHITWQDKQTWGLKHVVAGTWRVQSSRWPYFGYGYRPTSHDVKLWYEYETVRPQPVSLPSGKYNVRLVLTEESFHSNRALGGFWKSVLGTEDFVAGAPDKEAANDIVFTIE